MIRVRELIVRFGDVVAVELPALDIEEGERLGIEGANGSGKTTLLRTLAGLQPLTAGRIEGQPPRGRIVLVHQRPYFFRGSAEENVAYALRLRGRPASEASAWLDLLGAARLRSRPARALSEGQGRRVALARALAAGPEVLLLDETYAALDEEGRSSAEAALRELKGTVVIAAPDVSDCITDRIVRLGKS